MNEARSAPMAASSGMGRPSGSLAQCGLLSWCSSSGIAWFKVLGARTKAGNRQIPVFSEETLPKTTCANALFPQSHCPSRGTKTDRAPCGDALFGARILETVKAPVLRAAEEIRDAVAVEINDCGAHVVAFDVLLRERAGVF